MTDKIPPWMIPTRQRRDQPAQIPLQIPLPPPGYYDDPRNRPPHSRNEEDDGSVTIDIGGDREDDDSDGVTYRF